MNSQPNQTYGHQKLHIDGAEHKNDIVVFIISRLSSIYVVELEMEFYLLPNVCLISNYWVSLNSFRNFFWPSPLYSPSKISQKP